MLQNEKAKNHLLQNQLTDQFIQNVSAEQVIKQKQTEFQGHLPPSSVLKATSIDHIFESDTEH
jgi:hypothetical protein